MTTASTSLPRHDPDRNQPKALSFYEDSDPCPHCVEDAERYRRLEQAADTPIKQAELDSAGVCMCGMPKHPWDEACMFCTFGGDYA